MDLSAAKIGEVYEFYVDDGFAIVNRKTSFTMRGTVLGIYSSGMNIVVVGWCAEDGFTSTGAVDIHPTIRSRFSIPEKYVRAFGLPFSILVASCVNKLGATFGHTCSECSYLFQYAEHDVSNGKYVCGLCKGRARMFGGA